MVEGTYAGPGYMREQISSEGYVYDAKMQADFNIFVYYAGLQGSSTYIGEGQATFTGTGVVRGGGGAYGDMEEPWPMTAVVEGAVITLYLQNVSEPFHGTIRGQGNQPRM